MNIWIVSPGGVGSTYLISFLKSIGFNTNSPGDGDRIKHVPNPNNINRSTFAKFDKIIYLCGNPECSVRSHYRRGWAKVQSDKLGKKLNFNRIDHLLEFVDKEKQDPFGFNNWYNYKESIDKPILFTYLEEIYQNPQKLCKFLNIELEKLKNFQIKTRHCNSNESTYYNNLWDQMKSKIKAIEPN